MNPRHVLSNIDSESLTGTCSVCGSTNLYRRKGDKGKVRFVCMTKRREYATTRYPSDLKPGSNTRAYFKDVEGWNSNIREELWEEQGRCCALCEKTLTLTEARLDHCHNKKKIRQVLCTSCNLGLGMFKDDVKLLQAAINYLTKHS